MIEHTPQENAATVWNAVLEAIRDNSNEPRLAEHTIVTEPPLSQDPEEIKLIHEYDSEWDWRYTHRILTLTAEGVKSYRYQNIHRDQHPERDLTAEDPIDQTFGPNEEPTLRWLGRVANKLREEAEIQS